MKPRIALILLTLLLAACTAAPTTDRWTTTATPSPRPAATTPLPTVTFSSTEAPSHTPIPPTATPSPTRTRLLHLLRGDLPEAQTVYDTLQATIPAGQPGHAYAELAAAFWDEYQASQSIGQACSKAIEYAAAHPVEILAYLGNSDYSETYFGQQSLNYQPADICPFK